MPEPRGSAEPNAPARPGDRIRLYEILEVIGQGGMGVVYRARDHQLHRDVALKCPWPAQAADAVGRGRFLREIRIASRLSHPNIVPLYEAFEEDGLPWIVMQFVPGKSLRTIIQERGHLSVDHILEYSDQITAALQHAHHAGVLHRDIKPQNVLISGEHALLTDFGLSRLTPAGLQFSTSTTDSPSITGTGAMVGTPYYMSPEQVLGKDLDARSDIYSLGCVLYEMCTGRRPYAQQDPGALIRAIIEEEPEPIGRLNYGVPHELERIVRKCMAKRADERYQDTEDLLADVRRLARGAVPEPDRSARPKQRSRLTMALLLVGALGVFGAAAWTLRDRGETQGVVFRTPLRVTRAGGWEGEPAISPDGSSVAYAATVAGNTDIYVVGATGGSPLRITDDPASDREPTWFPDGQALAFHSTRPGGTGIWKVGRFGGEALFIVPGAEQPAISPDGTRIAFSIPIGSGFNRIGVAPLRDTARSVVLTGEDDGPWNHASPAWSPDGSTLCYAANQDLWTVPAEGGPARRLTEDRGFHMHPSWSADGTTVYFASMREETMALWSVPASGGALSRISLGTGQESHPSFAIRGSRMAYSTESTELDIVVLDSRTGERRVVQQLRGGTMPEVSLDGTHLVARNDWVGNRNNLWLCDLVNGVATGEARQLTDESMGNASHPTFSPDGRWIAYYRIDGENREIAVVPASGGPPVTFAEDPGNDVHPAWSPDGTELAFISDRSGSLQLWVAPIRDGRATGPSRRLTDSSLPVNAPAWSPDGSRIAVVRLGESGGRILLVAPTSGEALDEIDLDGNVLRVRWLDPETLLVSGLWEKARVSFRKYSIVERRELPLDHPIVLGSSALLGLFGVSAGGGLVVFSQEEVEGDIWVLQTATAP